MKKNKIILEYPDHIAFNELLNSCGSMTKQLEKMGHQLTVELIYEGRVNNNFCRYTILKLDNIPVILALSQTIQNNTTFSTLLQNANNTPIGKFLFAPNSNIIRNEVIISQINTISITDKKLSQYIISNYNQLQNLFQRESVFHYQDENMSLIEIILPELTGFIK